VVGATGFEPVTTRTPSVCATRLRYAPTMAWKYAESNTPKRRNQFNAGINSAEEPQGGSQESNLRRDSKSFFSLTRALLYFCSESGSLSWSLSSFLFSFNFRRAPSMVKPSL
jgi:hypothetical protein